MTNAEIDALPAGRELDALVAEKVMGWTCVHLVRPLPREIREAEISSEFQRDYGLPAPPGYAKAAVDDLEFSDGDYPPKWCERCKSRDYREIFRKVPAYSTYIAAAHEVLDELQQGTFHIQLDWLLPNGWLVSIGGGMGVANEDGIHGKGLPLMICRAALKAVASAAPPQ